MMKQTGPEIHMWQGLKSPIYNKLRVIGMQGPRIRFNPSFKAANDNKYST